MLVFFARISSSSFSVFTVVPGVVLVDVVDVASVVVGIVLVDVVNAADVNVVVVVNALVAAVVVALEGEGVGVVIGVVVCVVVDVVNEVAFVYSQVQSSELNFVSMLGYVWSYYLTTSNAEIFTKKCRNFYKKMKKFLQIF